MSLIDSQVFMLNYKDLIGWLVTQKKRDAVYLLHYPDEQDTKIKNMSWPQCFIGPTRAASGLSLGPRPTF